MNQLAIDFTAPPRFDGADYKHERDAVRLSGQILRVFEVIRHGGWFTLEDIAVLAQAPPASVSAQLRNLRKARFGGFRIERRYEGEGLYMYHFGGRDGQR